jgi:uncharacterized protein (TIGR02217 family)
MPIIVLADVVLPNSVITAGIKGKNMRMNVRNMTNNGFGDVNIVWTKTLRQYEIGIAPMLVSQWQAIEGLHEITEGGAYGFLMEDPKDNVTVNCPLSLVSGHLYQLQKRYVTAGTSRYKDRAITRPKAAPFVLSLSGSPMDPSLYTLDVTTGQVSIPSAPSAALLSWTGGFYVPVQFMNDEIDWELDRGGSFDTRLLSGPSVILMEVRE